MSWVIQWFCAITHVTTPASREQLHSSSPSEPFRVGVAKVLKTHKFAVSGQICWTTLTETFSCIKLPNTRQLCLKTPLRHTSSVLEAFTAKVFVFRKPSPRLPLFVSALPLSLVASDCTCIGYSKRVLYCQEESLYIAYHCANKVSLKASLELCSTFHPPRIGKPLAMLRMLSKDTKGNSSSEHSAWLRSESCWASLHRTE